MPRNGSGQYDLVVNSWNPAVNGVPATPADWQSLINDVAAALSQSLSRDGQTVAIGNLPMGGNKLTGLGVGTAAGDSLAWQQLFSQGTQVDLASAATTDIGLVNSTNINITGTTTITSFGLNYNGPRYLRFNAALTLTHSANLVLPGLGNILTAAGDSAIVVPLGAPASGWRVVSYQRAADAPGIPDNSITTAKIQDDAVTFAKTQNIATATILGRASAGTGNIEELTTITVSPLITSKIQPIVASVAANALNISLNPTTLDFRDVTLNNGAVDTRIINSTRNLTIPNGATLGTTNGVAARFVVLAINNAGTVELAVVNLAGGNSLDETGPISTTAINSASDSANVFYSTTARTNVAYRVVGFVDNTQATAGTYATAPSLVQGAGGQAFASLSSLGYGQSMQQVQASRISGVTYYNTTGKPIVVFIYWGAVIGSGVININGTVWTVATSNAYVYTTTFIVPPGQPYSVTGNFNTAPNGWLELR